MPRPLIQRPPEPVGPVDKARHWWNQLLGRVNEGLQPGATRDAMLPVLIEVFAGFSKLDGEVEEEEIERSLGYLRYDYSGAIYSDMRRLYFEALQQPQDLAQRAVHRGRLRLRCCNRSRLLGCSRHDSFSLVFLCDTFSRPNFRTASQALWQSPYGCG